MPQQYLDPQYDPELGNHTQTRYMYYGMVKCLDEGIGNGAKPKQPLLTSASSCVSLPCVAVTAAVKAVPGAWDNTLQADNLRVN